MQKNVYHTVLWQNLQYPGTEYCRLSSYYDGWQLAGTALLLVDGHPSQVHYEVTCDKLWYTRKVEVAVELESTQQSLRLTVDQAQRWWLAGQELESLRGCLDIDLGFTPATNTLPIRRLKLGVGLKAKVAAVWVKFPTLEIKLLPQSYTRLAEHRYRYESGGGTFVAELDVDEVGLVTHYPGGWQHIE